MSTKIRVRVTNFRNPASSVEGFLAEQPVNATHMQSISFMDGVLLGMANGGRDSIVLDTVVPTKQHAAARTVITPQVFREALVTMWVEEVADTPVY